MLFVLFFIAIVLLLARTELLDRANESPPRMTRCLGVQVLLLPPLCQHQPDVAVVAAAPTVVALAVPIVVVAPVVLAMVAAVAVVAAVLTAVVVARVTAVVAGAVVVVVVMTTVKAAVPRN